MFLHFPACFTPLVPNSIFIRHQKILVMKKILFAILCGFMAFTPVYISAQCTFANPSIRLTSPPVTNANGQCMIQLELSFDILHNNGGKYFWVHFWPTSVYPNYSYASSKPPVTSNLPGGNGALDLSVATFGFYHQGEALQVLTSYPPDNQAPGFQSAYTIHEIENGGILPGSDRYTVSGLNLLLPQSCTLPQSITADLWESQAAQSQQVACFTKNVPFYINDPLVSGLYYCSVPREYSFTIRSIRSSGELAVNYDVMIDNGDGLFNRGQDTLIINTGSALLNSTGNYLFSSGRLGYLPYSGQRPYANQSLWVVISSPALPNEVYALLYNGCIILPAELKTFTVSRDRNEVILRWTSLTESDNQGFYIERKTGTGEWTTTGFVASLAATGNSLEELNYQYTEVNQLGTITEYRLRQTDLKGNYSYSPVRLVKGVNTENDLLIYPNPSQNGQISIALNRISAPFKIDIYDLQGRRIRQQVVYRQTDLTLSGFNPGIYTLTVTLNQTGEILYGKFIISK
jgi:Secretion system C-terminal sorting domain